MQSKYDEPIILYQYMLYVIYKYLLYLQSTSSINVLSQGGDILCFSSPMSQLNNLPSNNVNNHINNCVLSLITLLHFVSTPMWKICTVFLPIEWQIVSLFYKYILHWSTPWQPMVLVLVLLRIFAVFFLNRSEVEIKCVVCKCWG